MCSAQEFVLNSHGRPLLHTPHFVGADNSLLLIQDGLLGYQEFISKLVRTFLGRSRSVQPHRILTELVG